MSLRGTTASDRQQYIAREQQGHALTEPERYTGLGQHTAQRLAGASRKVTAHATTWERDVEIG